MSVSPNVEVGEPFAWARSAWMEPGRAYRIMMFWRDRVVRVRLTILAIVCVAVSSVPAAAQLFQNPTQRTIVLSPGWHLSGPPVRSAEGLRFAVRSDAGVMRDMTVLPNGAITFSPNDRKTRPAPSQERRKARTVARPLPDRTPGQADDAPKKVTAKLDGAAPAPSAAVSSAPPDAAPPRASAPVPVAAPKTGPGYAHGVPINPLD
jgi:hypothetical protein